MLKAMTDDEKRMLQRADRIEKSITACIEMNLIEQLHQQLDEPQKMLEKVRLQIGLLDVGHNVPCSFVEEIYKEGWRYVGEMEFRLIGSVQEVVSEVPLPTIEQAPKEVAKEDLI